VTVECVTVQHIECTDNVVCNLTVLKLHRERESDCYFESVIVQHIECTDSV
jgi:hypothetical protein